MLSSLSYVLVNTTLLTPRAAIPHQICLSYDIVINSDSKRVNNKKTDVSEQKNRKTHFIKFFFKFLELKANSGMIFAGVGMS
jgi:hypothetical protein